MNCKKRFLQFILHFPACIAPAPFLQEHPHLRQNPGGFCRISTAFLQPHPYSCISPCIFSVSSVIFEAFPCKNRRGPVEGSRRSVQLPSKICEIPPQTQDLHDHLILAHAAGREVPLQIEGGEHAPVGDDAGNEVRRREIERRIVALHAFSCCPDAHGLKRKLRVAHLDRHGVLRRVARVGR